MGCKAGSGKFLEHTLLHLIPSTEPLPAAGMRISLNISTTMPGRPPSWGPLNLYRKYPCLLLKLSLKTGIWKEGNNAKAKAILFIPED